MNVYNVLNLFKAINRDTNMMSASLLVFSGLKLSLKVKRYRPFTCNKYFILIFQRRLLAENWKWWILLANMVSKFLPLREVSKYGIFSGSYFPVFSPNTGKNGPEKTPYLDTFHAVCLICNWNVPFSVLLVKIIVPSAVSMSNENSYLCILNRFNHSKSFNSR